MRINLPLTFLLSLSLLPLRLLGQGQVEVSGRVTDNFGDPIVGAAVMIEGTTTGTVTDEAGAYHLTAPSGGFLSVTFLGYDDDRQPVAPTVDFQLFESYDELEELVVVGYGAQKRSDLTGAVQSIKRDDILVSPTPNAMEALEGKVAGLDITRTDGRAGSGVNMQLRGNRSFSASGTPLFIIDGMPGDYATLNPNDIESIEILKDASSTAIYGASGANGVVLITTRHGQEGRPVVNFSMYAGVNGWSRSPKVRMGESFLQGIRDAYAAQSDEDGNPMWQSTADDEKCMNLALGDEHDVEVKLPDGSTTTKHVKSAWQAHQDGDYIDWVDELVSNSSVQNYSLSVSGGTDNFRGYLSLNYSDERGQFEGDACKTYSSNVKLEFDARKWLTIGLNTQLSYQHRLVAASYLDQGLTAMPLGELRDENGELQVNTWEGVSSAVNLLVNNASNYRENRQNLRVDFNPFVEVRPMEGLSIRSRAQASIANNRTNKYEGQGTTNYYKEGGITGTTDKVYASIATSRSYNYKWENIVTYEHSFNGRHDFKATFVHSWEHNQGDNATQKETNVKDDYYLWNNMGQSGQDKSSVGSNYTMYKQLSFVGRINYSFDSRYLASVSLRGDGNSKLADGYRWDKFPAFSVGWRISQEAFMSGVEWLDNLKARFGWGVSGTAGIPPFQSVTSMEQAVTSFSGERTDVFKFGENYPNEKLGWEKSYTSNLGLDFGAWGGRLTFNLDLYKTRTKGIILERALPVTNGAFDSQTQYNQMINVCETRNKGVELQANTVNIKGSHLEWRSALSFTANREEISKLLGGDTEMIPDPEDPNLVHKLGEAVTCHYNHRVLGVWTSAEAADAAVFGCEPGDLKVATNAWKVADGVWQGYKTNPETGEEELVTYDNAVTSTDDKGNEKHENRYTISGDDSRILGHETPDWTLGFKNELSYRGIDFSMFMMWRWGQTIKYDLMGYFDPKGANTNFPETFDYWTPGDESADFPAMNANKALKDYTGYYGLSYVDGSFFKIKNITLGYTLPQAVLSRLGLQTLRIYGTITNPAIHAKSHLLDDYDPEQNGQVKYPLTRQLVFGLNLTF